MKTPIGRFVRDGETRDAYTTGEVTSLRNAGWSPVADEPEPVITPPETVEPFAEGPAASETPKPETKRSHRKRKDESA